MTESNEPRHDESRCTVCGRTFWGARAFDLHRPCHTSKWLPTSNETWRVLDYKGEERANYKAYAGAPYVLLHEWDRYVKAQKQMRKVREGRGK